MRQFIFYTGLISIVAGVAFQFSSVAAILMPSESPGMLMHVFGLMAAFLGVMLIVCSRDLQRRGQLVAWEGILRVAGGLVMAGYGLLGGAGMLAVGSGLSDFLVGVIYLVGLPRHLGVTIGDLLLDQGRL